MITKPFSTLHSPLFILHIIILLLYGCKNYNIPEGFPKPDRMADILTEIHIVESTINNGISTTPAQQNEYRGYYKGALAKYGYTSQQFDTIRKWYGEHTELYQQVYDMVIVNLSRRETDLSILLDKEKEVKALSPDNMQPLQSSQSAELWSDSTSITVLPTDNIDRRLPFNIPADTLSLSGMLKLTAKYRFMVDDASRNPRMMLAASYADTVPDTVYTSIPHSFTQQEARISLNLHNNKKVSAIFGYLLLQDSLIQPSVEIKEISLQTVPDTVQSLGFSLSEIRKLKKENVSKVKKE